MNGEYSVDGEVVLDRRWFVDLLNDSWNIFRGKPVDKREERNGKSDGE